MTDDETAYDRERIERQPVVGIDGESAEHRFDQYHDRVYVLDADGELEHVQELEPGELSGWIDYVAEKRGWQECRYVDGDPFNGLVQALADGLDA